MAVIGIFAASKSGGWQGNVQTLTMSVKVRFVPNDNQVGDNAPAFRLFSGKSEIGAAWTQRSDGDNSKVYLRVVLDDPSLDAPISAALFPSSGGSEAQLVWRRHE